MDSSPPQTIPTEPVGITGRDWRSGLIAAALYFVGVFLVFGAWVHYYYAGNYSGPLWISTFFGISQESIEAGARPVYRSPIAGWDGQFYYTQSNDPLLLNDYKGSTLFDSASYRYQRNTLPMLAWCVGKLTGAKRTTPWTYYATQVGIVALGFGALTVYLRRRGLHPAWALVWACFGGVIRPMSHGLPDPTADALLLGCCLAVLSNRILIYAVLASLLCVCRESYAAPAAALWLLTVLNRVQWNDTFTWWLRVGLTALPGVAVLSWAAYVAHQTDSQILAGSRNIPWGGLVDWPFKAYFQCLWLDIKASDEHDVWYASSCALCLTVVSVMVVVQIRRSIQLLALLPHIILMTMTGWIVWEAGVGFFKNTSSVVLIGVLLLPALPTMSARVMKLALVIVLISSLHYLYRSDIKHQPYLPPLSDELLAESSGAPSQLIPSDPDLRYSSKLELLSKTSTESSYRGIFGLFHREPIVFRVRVTNTGDQVWKASIPGMGAVCCAAQFRKGEMVLREDRLPVYKNVEPGESIEFTFCGPSSGKPDRYHVRVGMLQDGRAWFFWDHPEQKLDIPY